MTNYLIAEKERLTKILRKVKRQLENAPNGSLKISTSKGTNQYLVNHKYVSKKDLSLVKAVAQKEYNVKVLRVADKKLKLVERLMKMEKPEVVWNEYYKLCPGRKELVKPIEETREQYEQNWMAVEYESNNYRKEEKVYETQHGEFVRSKSEALIANILFSNKICYRYEYPVKTQYGLTVYPDFYVLNSRTHEEFVYEHFGMMDNENYQTKNLQKINTYLSLGYVLGKNLLITFESSTVKFEPKQVNAFINQFFL